MIYQALPASDYTRRLILEPSQDEVAPLVGRLEVFDLSQDSSGCSYEAISYAWGSDTKDQTILIHGRPMHITTSLRDSLRQTRRPDQPRVLWADAICINQENDREKGHQVNLMGQIYKTSRCTLVCLGNCTESWPRQVATLAADVEAMIERVMAGDDPDLHLNLGMFPWLKDDDPLLADERWYSWAKLMMQPRFELGWVVQETALGPECRVLWSGLEISWMSILRAGSLIMREHQRIGASRGELEGFRGRGSLPLLHLSQYVQHCPQEANSLISYNPTTTLFSPLLDTLNLARALKLKDPRDRIYAFMALPTSDVAMTAIHVSYEKDVSHLDVYRDFATRYVAKSSNLDILQFAQHGDDEAFATASPSCSPPLGQVRFAHTFPSWIPRWDRGPMSAASNLIGGWVWRNFDLGSQEEVKILCANSTLHVKAIIFDSVDYASIVVRKPNQPGREAVAPAVSLWRDIAEYSIYPGGPHRSYLGSAEEFLVVLCVGQVSYYAKLHWKFGARRLKTFAKLLEADWIQQNPSMGTHEKDHNAKAIASVGLELSKRTRFLVLGRDYYAVSSVATRVGDVCAIISGTRSPFILREVDSKKDHYVLVGAAYVQSKVLTDEGLPGRMGESESFDDWKEWNLPTRDIFLC